MRRPDEALDDFTFRPTEKSAEPPKAVTLYFAGEVERLRPLGRAESLPDANPDPSTGNPFRRQTPNRFSLFQSAMAAAAALGIMLVVFLSAVFIGMSDPAASRGIAEADGPLVVDESLTAEIINPETLTARSYPLAIDDFGFVRQTASRVTARRFQRPTHTTRRPLPKPQITKTTFVPTTLIIFAEDGEIKSRIEPQIAAVYTKPLTISN